MNTEIAARERERGNKLSASERRRLLKKGLSKVRRGFAAMSPEQQREIASKGGLTMARIPGHHAAIGAIGGLRTQRNRRLERRRALAQKRSRK